MFSKIGRNVLGGSVYVGTLATNGKLVAISEWIFPLQVSYANNNNSDIFEKRVKTKKVAFTDGAKHEESILMKQLASIDQEMSSLQTLSHANVVPYLGMSYAKYGKSV